MTSEPEPNWDESNDWDEFQWESAFKYSEHMTAKYFRHLCRFGDLPDAEKFIAASIGDSNYFAFEEELDPSLGLSADWQPFDGQAEDGDHEPDGLAPGDPLYYETFTVFARARQIALGWCNVVASVLTQDDRMWGLKVLFFLGRILSYLAMSIGDGTFERIDGSIAFAKRVMQQLNTVLGELDRKEAESPQYASMFKLIREHLLETHDLVVDYLVDLRKRKSGDYDAAGPAGDAS